nr:unnamed protein product [Callosobruchus analis]
MAAVSSVPHSVSLKAREEIPKSKVLVVGAGGIGCEVLKNLALSGFQDIEIFLFRKEHVGKPKAVVAKESILSFNPDIKVKAYHDSVTRNMV